MPRDAERITYELDYMFGQLVTKHNPAPSPSGHPLLSGTPSEKEDRLGVFRFSLFETKAANPYGGLLAKECTRPN